MDKKLGEEVLLDVASILRYCRIQFFLIMGTALGAYRDGGFVPLESDIDIGILYENLHPKCSLLMQELKLNDFKYRAVSEPFDSIRSFKIKRGGIKVDLVSYVLCEDKRFCTNAKLQGNYAIVHDRSLLETYQEVVLFNQTFLVPSPIERYLELEYGPDWRTPKDDSKSRTRVKNFVKQKGLPRDYLRRFQTHAIPESARSNTR